MPKLPKFDEDGVDCISDNLTLAEAKEEYKKEKNNPNPNLQALADYEEVIRRGPTGKDTADD